MKLIIYLSRDEANRTIEDEDENIMPAYKKLIQIIENECVIRQIRYDDIEVKEDE